MTQQLLELKAQAFDMSRQAEMVNAEIQQIDAQTEQLKDARTERVLGIRRLSQELGKIAQQIVTIENEEAEKAKAESPTPPPSP